MDVVPGAKALGTRKGAFTGAAWLSSARVVRCSVKSGNERNPRLQLPASKVGDSGGTNPLGWEGGDDVKSVWPLHLGLHTCYNAWYKRNQDSLSRPSSPDVAKASTLLLVTFCYWLVLNLSPFSKYSRHDGITIVVIPLCANCQRTESRSGF